MQIMSLSNSNPYPSITENRCCLSTLTRLTNHVLYISIMVLICLTALVDCEEECLRSKVWCYECESINDPYCSDPFNVSFDMSLMKMCEGCCVKIVLEKNTPQKNIWRTCTSRLQINLFMVDHVCMEESGGQGHMCFCESDGCNGNRPMTKPSNLMGHLFLIITLNLIVTTSSSLLLSSSSTFPFGFLKLLIPIYTCYYFFCCCL